MKRLTYVSTLWCKTVCPLALLLVRLPFALLVLCFALSPLFFSSPLDSQIVHPLPPVLGEEPHSAVAMKASLFYYIAQALQPGEEAVKVFRVGCERV